MGQIISQDNLILRREKWKGNGQCVVFVSGTFDLLHPGHVRLLEQARSHGDVLVVGVRSDESFRVDSEKNGRQENDPGKSGPEKTDSQENARGKSGVNRGRPITPTAERAEILASLASVDIVVTYDEPSPASLISRLAPEIIVEGGAPMAGVPSTEAASGAAREERTPKVVRIVLEPGFSTARIIERIQQVSA